MRILALIGNYFRPAAGLGDIVGGVVGTVGGIASLFGGGRQGTAGFTYQPKSMGAADAAYGDLLKAMSGQATDIYGTASPLFEQSLQQGLGVDWNPYLQAAQQAGGVYGGLAEQAGGYNDMMQQQAQQALGQQGAMYGAGQQMYQNAFDPQQALYNQMANQNMQQSGAINSMYGLGSSGAGAGMAEDSMRKFNMDWQNQQLQRQLTGLQGMSAANQGAMGLGNYAGGAMGAGLGFGDMQAGYLGQAASTPQQAQMAAASYPGALAGQYTAGMSGAMAPEASAMSGAGNYLGWASGQLNNNWNVQNQANTFNAQQQAGAMQGLTNGLNTLGGMGSPAGGMPSLGATPGAGLSPFSFAF